MHESSPNPARAPLQNRVDPGGELHATSARGTLMGNRGGRFHRNNGRLGARRHVSRRWIACVCQFKQRQRVVWGAGYTELFFLDEVTALAAGHRPCFECRRAEADAFLAAFPFGAHEKPCADAMDRRLDGERREGRRKRLHPIERAQAPDGACHVFDGKFYVVRGGIDLLWSHEGYSQATTSPPALIEALTPPSILRALQNGYRPRWHESAERFIAPPR